MGHTVIVDLPLCQMCIMCVLQAVDHNTTFLPLNLTQFSTQLKPSASVAVLVLNQYMIGPQMLGYFADRAICYFYFLFINILEFTMAE